MSKRILVIEDQEDNRRILRHLLGSVHYEVLEAVTGEDGVALAERERPDLILMDIQLPGLDGYEATRRINGNPERRDGRARGGDGCPPRISRRDGQAHP